MCVQFQLMTTILLAGFQSIGIQGLPPTGEVNMPGQMTQNIRLGQGCRRLSSGTFEYIQVGMVNGLKVMQCL